MTNLITNVLSQTRLSLVAVASLSLPLLAVSTTAQASDCKGLENETCLASDSCGWVDSYVRKDGREVKAFCRTSTKGRIKDNDAKVSATSLQSKSSS